MAIHDRIRLTGLLTESPAFAGFSYWRTRACSITDPSRIDSSTLTVKSEALVRLLICDLVGEEVTRESVTTLRADIADLRERLDDSERTAREYPHRAKYLLLVVDFLHRLLELHEQLVDDVERELAGPQKTSSPANPNAHRT